MAISKGASRELALKLNEKLLKALNILLDTSDPIDIPAATYSVINKIIDGIEMSEEELDIAAKNVLDASTDSGSEIDEEAIQELRKKLRLVNNS